MKKNWNYEFKTISETFDENFVKNNILLEIHNMIEVNEMHGVKIYTNFCIKNGVKEFMEWCKRNIDWAKEIKQLLSSNGVSVVDNKQQPINVLETIENKKLKSPKI